MIHDSCKHGLDFTGLEDEQALVTLAACANGEYDDQSLAPWRRLHQCTKAIAPALAEPDSRGWHKEDVWRYGEGTGQSGDDRIGTSFDARYWKEIDGQFFVATEEYYVKNSVPNCDRPHGSYEAVGSYMFTICTDLEDVGGTEVWSDVEYDYDLNALYCDSLADAETQCRRFALADQRHTLLWEGGIPIR